MEDQILEETTEARCDWCRQLDSGGIILSTNPNYSPNYNCLSCKRTSVVVTCASDGKRNGCGKTFHDLVRTGDGRSACPHCFFRANSEGCGNGDPFKNADPDSDPPGQRSVTEVTGSPNERRFLCLFERAYGLIEPYMRTIKAGSRGKRQLNPLEDTDLHVRMVTKAVQCSFRWREEMLSARDRVNPLEAFDAYCLGAYKDVWRKGLKVCERTFSSLGDDVIEQILESVHVPAVGFVQKEFHLQGVKPFRARLVKRRLGAPLEAETLSIENCLTEKDQMLSFAAIAALENISESHAQAEFHEALRDIQRVNGLRGESFRSCAQPRTAGK